MPPVPDRVRRVRLWPTVAALLGLAITIALGTWQLGRAAQKSDLRTRYEARSAAPPVHVGADELDARDLELHRVEARGVYEPRYTVFIDNRIQRGVPGYHVVMPLRIQGSDRYVLVNRGWLARPAHRTELPDVRTPRGAVTVTGIAVIPGGRMLELSQAVFEGPIWQNLTIERYRARMPILVQPFVVRQDNDYDDGLVRVAEEPDFGIARHYGYAFQWFALAVTILVFYAVTQFRRTTPRAP